MSSSRHGNQPPTIDATHSASFLGFRSANLLIKQHGEDAPILAAMRADAMLEAGDLDGYATWKRILRAVEELRGTEPGARVH